MGASLIQQCRVCEEGLRVVKHSVGKKSAGLIPSCLDVTHRRSTGYSVPAAAVIRRVQALIGITGRKAHVGGLVSQM